MQSGDPLTLDLHDIVQNRSIDGNWASEFMGRAARPVANGDVMTFSFATGGAGYGDSIERDPQSVLGDIKANKISSWVAEQVYKVALSENGDGVDLAGTQQARESERENRRQRGKPYAEFMAEWEQLKPPDEILAWFGAWPSGEAVQPIMRM